MDAQQYTKVELTIPNIFKKISVEEKIIETHIDILPQISGSSLYFVNAEFANVRSGAGINFGVTGRVNRGDIVEFQGVSANLDRSPTAWRDGWGWIRFAASNNWVAGWSGSGFNNTGGGHLIATHRRAFQGMINLSQVNFRTGPGTEYETSQIGNLLSLPQGTRINVEYFVARNSLPWSFTIPHRDLTQVWVCFTSIITPGGQRLNGRGWVRADLVGDVPFNLIQPSSPILGSVQNIPQTVTVVSPFLNRRSGPGTHTIVTGQYNQGSIINITRNQRNITEDRLWLQTRTDGWVASENTIPIEIVTNQIFRVNAPLANIRNAPDVSGTTVIGTQLANTRLRITHRRRVTGGMDWFRFDQVIDGESTIGWIADVNGFIEGDIGSPGIPMPANDNFPRGWIDSRAVSMRNPDFRQGHTTGIHRPFYATRNLSEVNQIVIHHTASPISLNRVDIETGWRGLNWWNGGYHEMIHADGRIDLSYEPEVVTNGAYGQNRISYHISLVGDFRPGFNQPTAAQMEVLLHRIRMMQQRLGVVTSRVVGHNERVPTICPGLNMNEIRSRVGGSVNPPQQPSMTDLQAIEIFWRDFPRRVADVIGFGPNIGLLNLVTPTITNKVHVSPTVPIGPFLEGRFVYQQVLQTSNPLELEIKDGKITNMTALDQSWGMINNVLSSAEIDLFGLNEFTRRLESVIGVGSASVFVEWDLPDPIPWLTLKVATELTLPSGNKFKLEMKFQIRARFRPSPSGNSDLDLGLEVLPDAVVVENEANRIFRNSQILAERLREEGQLTWVQKAVIIAVVAGLVIVFIAAASTIVLMPLAKLALVTGIIAVFNRYGINVESYFEDELV